MDCIIVHGCPSNTEKATDPIKRTYDKHWIPWVKRELEKKGITTEVPIMPTAWEPVYSEWKAVFDQMNITKDTVLIGHSCGCAFLVRWLGDTQRTIATLVLVAPWKIPPKNNMKKKLFYEYSVDSTINQRVKNILIFTADNEVADGKKSAELFHSALGGTIIVLKGRGHYTFDDMGTEAFPEILEELLL